MICLNKQDIYLNALLKQEGAPFDSDYSEGKIVFLTITPRHLIITDFADCSFDVKSHPKKIGFIFPDDSDFFRNVGLVDINSLCWIPEGANRGVSNKGDAVVYFATDCSKGIKAVLPLDLARLSEHRGIIPKKFYAPGKRFPYENVAVADRGGVRRLLFAVLKQIFIHKQLPYIRLSYVPGFSVSAFGFRVDTDFSPPLIIEKARHIADKVGMRWTWFVDVAHNGLRLKEILDILAGQDIQLHCYRHLVYPDYLRNKLNFSRGKEIITQAGINSIGVAAPYGEWNQELQRALEELGFEYSSEFGYSYDDLPSHPWRNGESSPMLEIPVHPISLGRLVWAKADRKSIFDYFRRVIDRQCSRLEPCFLYDHPQWIVQYQDVMEDVLRYGIEQCGSWTTLTEYHHWWIQREQIRYDISITKDGMDVRVKNDNSDVALVIENKNEIAFVPLVSGLVTFKDLKWIKINQDMSFDKNEICTRRSDWKIWVYEMLRRSGKINQLKRERSL